MNKRKRADHAEIAHQLGSLISPTIEAGLCDIDDLIEETELSSGVLRNLAGASRELNKSLKSVNLAITACQMEISSKTPSC